MVQDGNTFVQTVDGTQYTFGIPDPDDKSWQSPLDFGLLTSMVDPYGNENRLLLSDRQLPACQPDFHRRPRLAGADRLRGQQPGQPDRDREPGPRDSDPSGSPIAGSTSATPTIQDSALQFNGTSYATLPTVDFTGGNFTISLWFDPTSKTTSQFLFMRGFAYADQQGDIGLKINPASGKPRIFKQCRPMASGSSAGTRHMNLSSAAPSFSTTGTRSS